MLATPAAARSKPSGAWRVLAALTLGTLACGAEAPELPPGPYLVADINPGAASSLPAGLIEHKGALYVAAVSAETGREWWRSDGTREGTRIVKDIQPGRAGAVFDTTARAHGRLLLFTADTPGAGIELWSSDGSEQNTTLVADLLPGSFIVRGEQQFLGSRPTFLGRLASGVLFTALDAPQQRWLWRSDGTRAGSVKLARVGAGRGVELEGALYFEGVDADTGSGSHELWRSDGTASGTWLVRGFGRSVGVGFTQLGTGLGRLFFGTDDGVFGEEPWTSDGTLTGTRLLADIAPGPLPGSSGPFALRDGSRPALFVELRGRVLFAAQERQHGRELWSTDGTREGTRLVRDIREGPAGSIASGTTAGPAGVATTLGDVLLFAAGDAAGGVELWRSDGSAAGTQQVVDLNLGPASSSPRGLTRIGAWLYFYADDGAHGRELWRSDGTPQGTFLVHDIAPGPRDAIDTFAEPPVAFRSHVVFAADDGVHGRELWAAPQPPRPR